MNRVEIVTRQDGVDIVDKDAGVNGLAIPVIQFSHEEFVRAMKEILRTLGEPIPTAIGNGMGFSAEGVKICADGLGVLIAWPTVADIFHGIAEVRSEHADN